MRMRSAGVVQAVWGLVLVLTLPRPALAQVKVIISGGFSAAYQQLLPELERATGIAVVTTSGASRGDGPDTIAAQLGRGVMADVVIMNRPALDELIALGRVATGSDRDVASTLLGIAVRAGSSWPDVSSAEGFRQALLRAKVIAVADGNTRLAGEILPRLGIADRVTVKSGARSTDAVAMVSRGDAGLAYLPVSEILHMPGVELGGTIPNEFQRPAVYAAAIVGGSVQQAAAQKLIDFLLSNSTAEAIKRSGMEPSPRR